ncbi:MAG: PQQ-binding-like beta-propeller repeat protein [Planctomycetales bacterium]|nr:PQQ-binding-like beta-propeller repeat protein [Planctomycetales bacterium]
MFRVFLTFALWVNLGTLSFAPRAAGQENWPRFRGADATGVVADDPRLPDTWDQETNVLWKAAIPGRGWGSPIVWGDRVFVSAVHSDEEYEQPKAGLYLGLGRSAPPDSIHHWMVYCLSLTTGELIWKHEAHVGKPQMPRHPKNTYAAETPTTDGSRLYVLFGDVGLYCYDFEGQQLWAHEIEPKKTLFGYGAAASPVVADDQVIMVYDNQEESYIAALDCASGNERWRVARDNLSSWATPLVWKYDDQTEIVVPGVVENRSYGIDGSLLWHFNGQMSSLVIPSPFAVDGLLYITSGYFQDEKRPVFAIKPGARGDIGLEADASSNESIAWSLKKMGPYNTSPIVYGGYYYTLLDRGMITCHNAKTGELVYDRQRFPQGASFTASPWAYNGKVFFLDEDGETYVMPLGDEFKIDHVNSLDELCVATPSICQGKLLIRTAGQVYCISNQSN